MKKKLIMGAVGLVAAAAPIIAVPAMHASAKPADAVQTFMNGMSADCIDDSDQGLRMMDCESDNPHQQWEVRKWNDNTRQLKNVATGRCLDHSNQYGVRTFTCHDPSSDFSKFQSWTVDHKSGSAGDGEASGISLTNQATGTRLAEEGSGWFGIGGGDLIGTPADGGIDNNETWS
ncbi:RICIN domain-containing protein [Luteipulveratus mongoliensis]|uniref:RICIN domain-containing protein n=1 Tax=Luteipulveratus mongoliensis TaxID=571913 RepID=UPI000696BC04|nr:RICIN domain-containing protein [Luteipulveratus mongoliensis]